MTKVFQKSFRKRAEVLRLNAKGWSVDKIANWMNCAPNTVRRTIQIWILKGLSGLRDAPRSGRKRTWTEADIQYLENCCDDHSRTYNSEQLSNILKNERQVKLSPERIRKILKKKGRKWKRTKTSPRPHPDPKQKAAKKADLEQLRLEEAKGALRLKYLDEAGFSLWSPVSYSYIKIGEQKVIPQSKKRGKRLNIIGIYEPRKSLNYALALTSFKKESFIKVLDEEAKEAARHRAEKGINTVVILDNYSIPKSYQVKAKEKDWQDLGLYLFFLPTYSPELNLIESEWHQVKAHEISGRMFEDEYDLALAVKESLQNRSEQVGYSIQQFKLNSTSLNIES